MKSLKLIGLALGASFALSTAALAQDITIAVAGPMTGSESAFGRQMKNGAEQAVADLNAAGGVMGKKLAHRGYVMVNGLITLSGTGSELLQRPEIRAAYLEGGRRH